MGPGRADNRGQVSAASVQLHSEALERHAEGCYEEAVELLRGAVEQSIDGELLNDLAVALASAGMPGEARAVLLGLRVLVPSYDAARENLEMLGGGEPIDTDMREAQRLLMQLAIEVAGTSLPDNLDLHINPFGHGLPDPAKAGERLTEQLAVLGRCGSLWRNIGDEQSRALLLRLLAYRALGPGHVRLQLDPAAYYRAVAVMTAKMLRRAGVMFAPGAPFDWQVHLYDLADTGVPVQLMGCPLALASTYLFSQYAYRDGTRGAGPAPGDVVIDGGGCWGETALLFAHLVGEQGHVHSFEPGPANRELFAQNVALNPKLGERITLHESALGACGGETLWINDVPHPGLQCKELEDIATQDNVVATSTETIDAFVAEHEPPSVDMIKLDIESAEVAALEGARETIRAHRPKLAIACYHDDEHIAAIPAAIEAHGVAYRWYLQCATLTDLDTIAFGVPS